MAIRDLVHVLKTNPENILNKVGRRSLSEVDGKISGGLASASLRERGKSAGLFSRGCA